MDNEIAEEMPENLHERQLRQSSLIKNSLSLYHTDLVLMKENTSYRKYRAMVNDILEDPQQNIWISQIERSRDTAAASRSSK